MGNRSLTVGKALLYQDILAGKRECPKEGETLFIEVDSPDQKTKGRAAVKKCGGKCETCGLKPEPQDFEEVI